VIRVMSVLNVWAYRASGGRIGGRFLRGAPVCLVTTTGRKSGRPRTAPLLYLADGERVVIVASKGGMSKHPAWYGNLVANPRCTVEIGSERREMVARTASREEKAALWPRLVAMYRDYDDYQARTDRDIPVVVLEPA
jgi:deazaflavin-dependent oxidoreductase (nitroreductase family)